MKEKETRIPIHNSKFGGETTKEKKTVFPNFDFFYPGENMQIQLSGRLIHLHDELRLSTNTVALTLTSSTAAAAGETWLQRHRHQAGKPSLPWGRGDAPRQARPKRNVVKMETWGQRNPRAASRAPEPRARRRIRIRLRTRSASTHRLLARPPLR
jgi:hypothetical protein